MSPPLDALKISPNYTSRDWSALAEGKPDDWPQAAAIVRDRLEGRFLRFADQWISDPFSGFIVLAIDCLLAETIQQFRTGATSGKGKSERYITEFLSGPRFQPEFAEAARTSFYEDIRCGLLHQAEAKKMWLIRRKQPNMLQPVSSGNGYIIDVERFHETVRLSLQDYYEDIVDPLRDNVRRNLWKKMRHISRIREVRGLLYEAPDSMS